MQNVTLTALALALSATGCFAQLNVTASSHIVLMQYEAWFGPNAVGFEGSPGQPLLSSNSMRAAGRPGYDSADPQVLAQHTQWLSAMGVDTVLADLTNGVNCTFFSVWLPYCGDAATYAKFQTIKSNTANLYPAFTQLGTPLKIVPLAGGFDAIDFDTDTNGKTALEEELDWFAGLTTQYPRLNVLLDGKPLVVIYVGCAQPLDPTAIWRKAQALIPKYPNLTLRLMAADLDDQPPLWSNANGLAGLHEISQSNPFWSWVDRLNPTYNLFPSYLPGQAGPENLTASVATLSRQLGWGNAASGAYAPEDALSLGGATFRSFMAYARQLKPTFLIVHQWNEYAENGWDAETDTDIEPGTFFGTTMMATVQQEIMAYKTALVPAPVPAEPAVPSGITLGSTGQSLQANFSAFGTSTGGAAPSAPVSFTVTPCAVCRGAWSASPSADWVSISSGGSGTGVGAVAFNVLANTSLTSRSATITITEAGVAPVSITINEAGSTQSLLNRETQALYQRALGREPDASGFSFWTCTAPATLSPCANLGAAGLGQMVDLFLESPEGMSSDFQVLALYQAFLGRLPAFSEWSVALVPFRAPNTPAGWSAATSALIATLVHSSEYTGRYGATGNTGNAVANLYQNMLLRQPANSELASGIATVANSGLPGLFAAMFTGAEFWNTGVFASAGAASDHTNSLFVTMMYFAVLARDPDTAGFAFWMAVANSGGAGIYFQPAGRAARTCGIRWRDRGLRMRDWWVVSNSRAYLRIRPTRYFLSSRTAHSVSPGLNS